MVRGEVASASIDSPVVGLLTIGLAAYWPQMPAALAETERLMAQVRAILEDSARVVSPGLVDTSEKSAVAGKHFAREQVDLVVLLPGTYSTSSLMLPAILPHDAPVLIANVQSRASLDYANVTTEEFISHSGVACLSEMAGVLTRARRRFDVVSGTSDDPAVSAELNQHLRAAAIRRQMRQLRIGCIGQIYPGMLDFYVDKTRLQSQMGVISDEIEPDVLVDYLSKVSDADAQRVLDRVQTEFVIDPSVRGDDLWHAARVTLAFEHLAKDRGLGALTYYWQGTGATQDVGGNSTLGLSLLTADGVVSAPEGDILTAIVLKLIHWLTGRACITEFYFTDYAQQFVLMGHSAPVNGAMAEEKPTLRRLEMLHGKVGSGLSIDCRVQYGPVTLASLALTAEGDPKLLLTRGESIEGPIMRTGDQNSRIAVEGPLPEFFRKWTREGPTHHLGMGIGDIIPELLRTAEHLGIQTAVV